MGVLQPLARYHIFIYFWYFICRGTCGYLRVSPGTKACKVFSRRRSSGVRSVLLARSRGRDPSPMPFGCVCMLGPLRSAHGVAEIAIQLSSGGRVEQLLDGMNGQYASRGRRRRVRRFPHAKTNNSRIGEHGMDLG